MKSLIEKVFLLLCLVSIISFSLCTNFNAKSIGVEFCDYGGNPQLGCSATIYCINSMGISDIEESALVVGPDSGFRGIVSVNDNSPLYGYCEYLVQKLAKRNTLYKDFDKEQKYESIFKQLLDLIAPTVDVMVAGLISETFIGGMFQTY